MYPGVCCCAKAEEVQVAHIRLTPRRPGVLKARFVFFNHLVESASPFKLLVSNFLNLCTHPYSEVEVTGVYTNNFEQSLSTRQARRCRLNTSG